MKPIKLFTVFFLLLISLTGCAQNNPSNTITVNEFKEIMKDSSVIILDVRTIQELHGPLGKIEGAIHIPVQELDRRFHELDKYKDKTIAVICRTQNRSSSAAEFLRLKGFNAVCVYGGMTEYSKN